MDSVDLFIFGLGLFFTGLVQFTSNLKHLGGRRFRWLVQRYAHPRWKALLLGLVSGAGMQSSSAALMILAGLATTGLIAVQDAFPIMAAFNVGDTLLVFLATFNIQEAALLGTGLSAIILYFVKSEDRRRVFGVLMGLGLIFVSISTMKNGVKPMQQMAFVQHLVAYGAQQPLLSILIGVALGFVMQSSTVVATVAVGLVVGGLLQVPQTLVMLYASAVGSSLFKVLLSAGLTGSARQIVRYQNVFNYVGAVVFIALFYIEKYLHVPLVMAMMNELSDQPETQVAIAFLLFKIVSLGIMVAADRPIARWLERSLPKSVEEELSRPRFVSHQLPEDAATALDLIAREQMRELGQIAEFFSTVREGAKGPGLPQRLEALHLLGKEVEGAGRALMTLQLNERESLKLSHYQNRQTIILELAEVVAETTQVIAQGRSVKQLEDLSNQTLEALEFLLISVATDLESDDQHTQETLLGLCGDRASLTANLRKNYLQPESGLSLTDRGTMLALTTSVEKCVWLLRHLVTLHQTDAAAHPPGV